MHYSSCHFFSWETAVSASKKIIPSRHIRKIRDFAGEETIFSRFFILFTSWENVAIIHFFFELPAITGEWVVGKVPVIVMRGYSLVQYMMVVERSFSLQVLSLTNCQFLFSNFPDKKSRKKIFFLKVEVAPNMQNPTPFKNYGKRD